MSGNTASAAVAGGVPGFGDHERDRVAHVADVAVRQRCLVRLGGGGAVLVLAGLGLHGADAGGFEVGGGEDAEHTRHGAGLGDVDAAEDAVGVAAADDDGVGLAGEGQVVGVAAFTTEEDRVFLT